MSASRGIYPAARWKRHWEPMTEQSQIESWVEAASHGDQLAVSKLLATHHPMLRARAAAKISRTMRTKIEADASEPRLLVTVRGLGYRLDLA